MLSKMGKSGTSYTARWNVIIEQSLWKIVTVPQKVKHDYYITISLLVVYNTKELKTDVPNKYLYINLHSSTILIAKGKQIKFHSSIRMEWVNKIYTVTI